MKKRKDGFGSGENYREKGEMERITITEDPVETWPVRNNLTRLCWYFRVHETRMKELEWQMSPLKVFQKYNWAF